MKWSDGINVVFSVALIIVVASLLAISAIHALRVLIG